MSARRFIAVILATIVAGYVLLAAFASAVDPYEIIGSPRFAGWNQHKYEMVPFERTIKFHRMRQIRPLAIATGTSRANAGLRPASVERYAGRAYNFALNGATVEEIGAAVGFSIRVIKVKTVIFGMDPVSFINISDGQLANIRGRSEGGRWSQLNDLLRHTLTFRALLDALGTVWRNSRGLAPSHGPRGMYIGYGTTEITKTNRFASFKPARETAFATFEQMCALARRYNVDLKLFVSPVHISNRPYPAYRSAWLARMRAIAGRKGYAVYDPDADLKLAENKDNFFDSGHYKPGIGDRILAGLYNRPKNRTR